MCQPLLIRFASKNPREFQALKTRGEIRSKEDLRLEEEDQIREYLNQLDMHKSVGPDVTHP